MPIYFYGREDFSDNAVDTEIKVKVIPRTYFFPFALVLILIGQMIFRINDYIDTVLGGWGFWVFRGRKNHDSHRRDRIRRDFLHWIFRYFLQILGGSSYQITQRTWRKSKKSSGEPPVETAPRNCRFLSLVVVERVLSFGGGGGVPILFFMGARIFLRKLHADSLSPEQWLGRCAGAAHESESGALHVSS